MNKYHHPFRALRMPLLCLLVVVALAPAQARGRALQPSLVAFEARLPLVKKQVPVVTAAAQAAAERAAAHPEALVNVPYSVQPGFAEEIVNRAGGLGNAFPPEERMGETTPHDVLLLGVRSWEKDGEKIIPKLKEGAAKGWLTVVFASQTGKPADLPIDYLIDNGAGSGGANEATTNAIINALNSWLWCSEYVAALSRHGLWPGVLKSISYPDGMAFDQPLQKIPGGRQRLRFCSNPIPAGQLSAIYLRRIDQMVGHMESGHIQGQIAQAAKLAAEHIKAGRNLCVSGTGHIILSEIFTDNHAPWKPFHSVWQSKTAFKNNVKPGDLLLWIGYLGVNSALEDYATPMRATGADIVVCTAIPSDPAQNGPWAVGHLDQDWTLGDSEVPLPCPPDRMAPISGVNVVLLYRMLDDAVAARLAGTGK